MGENLPLAYQTLASSLTDDNQKSVIPKDIQTLLFDEKGCP